MTPYRRLTDPQPGRLLKPSCVGLMEQPTRVFKTLACLVVAMTATAAWLGCIDPSAPITPELQAYDVVQRNTRSLVVDDVTIHKGKWQGVDIVAARDPMSSGALLAARFDRSRYHFRIDLDGTATRTRRWERQEVSDFGEGAVIIGLARAPELPGMSRAQWQCLGALLAALRATTRETDLTQRLDGEVSDPDEEKLPVRVQEEWAKIYGLPAGSTVKIPMLTDSVS